LVDQKRINREKKKIKKALKEVKRLLYEAAENGTKIDIVSESDNKAHKLIHIELTDTSNEKKKKAKS
jgi:hypothetical protein